MAENPLFHLTIIQTEQPQPTFSRCHACIYWFNMDFSESDDDLGECHRYAPQPRSIRSKQGDEPGGGIYALWPMTFASEGCGEGVEIIPRRDPE